MSSSLFAAIARMSRFCSFVSFLIGSPFVRFGSASRDDTNDFFVVFFIKSMNDQKNRTRPYGSNCYPTFLILESDVALRNRVGIVENENGRFEANIVLVKVCRFFCSSHSNRMARHGWERIQFSRAVVNTFVC